MPSDILYNEEKADEPLETPTTELGEIIPATPSAEVIISPTIVGKYLNIQSNGDVTIGDYAGGQGIFWDQSAGVLSILGGLSIDYLDIPDTVTANSFHVDVDGNAWWGATTLAGALAAVLKTGVASFKSITLDTNVIIKDMQAGSVVDGTYINSLNVSKLVTGTISSKQITLAITGGSGDSYIGAGKTDFTNVQTGFILGLDDSDGDTPKFFIGDATTYLNWDGANLTVSASSIVKLFTAGMAITLGEAVFMYSDGKVYSTDALQASMVTAFIGIAKENIASAATGKVQTFGNITGLAGLTVGSIYYLKNATQNIDQSQTVSTTADQDTFGSERWQSFTSGAGMTHISQIEVYVHQGAAAVHNWRMKIYTGEGTGGTLLYTQTLAGAAAGDQNLVYTLSAPINISAATQYSITLEDLTSNGYWWYNNAGGYAGGRSSWNAAHDAYFITRYTTARGALNTAAGTVSKKVGIAISATEFTLKDSV